LKYILIRRFASSSVGFKDFRPVSLCRPEVLVKLMLSIIGLVNYRHTWPKQQL